MYSVPPNQGNQGTNTTESEAKDTDIVDDFDINTLAITAIHDYSNHLTEILINKYRYQTIPRVIWQLIVLVIPNYTLLTKITIKRCRIDMFTLYELGKLLPYSVITDVCLDECPLPDGNFDAILNDSSHLQNLSLCRCQINDVDCEKIASKLAYLEPVEEHLLTLNLSSNNITNVGAKHIAMALRSNRHLRYLNLADNLLSDEGANQIFDVLREFPMTHEETMDNRHRYMLYLKKKHAIYLECLQKFIQNTPVDSFQSIKKHVLHKRVSTVKSKSSIKKSRANSHTLSYEDTIPMKADMMALELVGPFSDPFCPTVRGKEDGCLYSVGNFSLCYLNLAYNDLTYVSIDKLLSLLEYQRELLQTTAMYGLMKVVLEGNYIPSKSVQLDTISNILYKRILSKHLFERAPRRSAVEKRIPLSK